MTTPAAYGFPLTSKITRPVHPWRPPYTARRRAPAGGSIAAGAYELEKGMWVLGHEDYVRGTIHSTIQSPFGEISFPSLGWIPVDDTKVECVAPAEREGGVLDMPRRYQAPPPKP